MVRWTVLLPFLLRLFIPAAFLGSADALYSNEAVIFLMDQMEASYARINDYEAIFHKQERIGGKLLPEETILIKFQKPLQVYMKWIGDPYKGTEVLYVQGRNDDKLLVHRGGILKFMTLSIDPKGSLAMKANRHPITEAGFGFLIEGLHRNIQEAVRNGDFKILRIADEPFRGRVATVVEARFIPRKGQSYYASRVVCHIDKELLLPTGVSFYDENGSLFEKYDYTQVRINVGLTAKDFSRDNKSYGF